MVDDLVQYKHVDVAETKIISGTEWSVLYELSCYIKVLTGVHFEHAGQWS